MKVKPFSQAQLEQERKDVKEALSLLRSGEWKQYVAFKMRRAAKFQKEANDAIRKGNLVQAQLNLALMDDNLSETETFKTQVLKKKEKLNQGEENHG